MLYCAQEKQKQVRSRDSGSKASASRGSREAQDMKFLQQFAVSHSDMTDLAAALTEHTRQPAQQQPQPGSIPALQENAPSGIGQATPPLTRDGAVEALAERCMQSLGLSEAQVCIPCPQIACLQRRLAVVPLQAMHTFLAHHPMPISTACLHTSCLHTMQGTVSEDFSWLIMP